MCFEVGISPNNIKTQLGTIVEKVSFELIRDQCQINIAPFRLSAFGIRAQNLGFTNDQIVGIESVNESRNVGSDLIWKSSH